ncbi:hypothetical protein IWQ60_009512 [Tieghemiomyces parasiticus]|uniref:Chromatin target of PRMT1 protein C-terminal domain-containing protein n=1 Tax=Tieghemiomyces parasiticus TaxID=78921 RepID=A0A9W7ZUF4_9FUNG|nr:hypothetical protein IWQ60_009512 [Tieghemiomyces parasiticus]
MPPMPTSAKKSKGTLSNRFLELAKKRREDSRAHGNASRLSTQMKNRVGAPALTTSRIVSSSTTKPRSRGSRVRGRAAKNPTAETADAPANGGTKMLAQALKNAGATPSNTTKTKGHSNRPSGQRQGGARLPAITKESLDLELDSYMLKEKDATPTKAEVPALAKVDSEQDIAMD